MTSLRDRLYNLLNNDPVFGDKKCPVKIVDPVKGINVTIKKPPFIVIYLDQMTNAEGSMSNHRVYRLEFWYGYSNDLKRELVLDQYIDHLCEIIHYGKINANVIGGQSTTQNLSDKREADMFALYVRDVNASF